MQALLIFSYDLTNPLFKLGSELNAVQSNLQHRKCTAVPKWQCGPEHLREFFDTYQAEVGILHFAGHAIEGHLQLNDTFEVMRMSFVEALAKRICQFGGLQLVFLNGCSTTGQAKAFLDNGVLAVISTRYPLKDRYGLKFARMFYNEFCKKKKTLRNAFDDTVSGFLSDFQAEKADWLDPDLENAVRGGGFLVDDEVDDQQVYKLDLNPNAPEAANATFEAWLESTAPPKVTELAESGQIKNLGVHPDSYLLCNRRDQTKTFVNFSKAKLEGSRSEPLFFFIHDPELNGPSELARRFQNFVLPKICPVAREPVEIFLDDIEDDFGDGEKYRITLSQLYAGEFGGNFDHGKNRYILQKITPDKNLMLVKHDLSDLEWDDSWDEFFSYYTDEYATALSRELSTRLVVVCTMDFVQQEPEFQQLFNRLATDLPERVFSFSNLEEINPKHVNRWQKDVFGGLFFQTTELFAGDGAPLAALPFLTAKAKLAEKINLFNLKQRNG